MHNNGWSCEHFSMMWSHNYMRLLNTHTAICAAANPIPFGLFFVLILSGGGANLPALGIYV